MYVVIEGADFTGKSTQAKMLANRLSELGHKIFLTKEPGSPADPVCQKIRNLLLDPDNKIERRTALFLFLADRAQHIEIIRQKLAEGYIVISDRSSLSTWVYYMAEFSPEERIEQEWITSVIDKAQQIAPDLAIICSADFDWRREGLIERGTLDRIEQKDDLVHRAIGDLFESTYALEDKMEFFPKNWVAAPLASKYSINHIHEFIWKTVGEQLWRL